MPSSNDDDNSDNDSVPVATPVTQRKRKHCNDDYVPATTTVTAQGGTCHPTRLHQPAESGETIGAIQNIELLEDEMMGPDYNSNIEDEITTDYNIY
eukprot:4301119-Ditylum_brightwellii.AAC.1